MKKLLVILTMGVLLTSCGTPATQAPLPTYTPYPTYTPFPTSTPMPEKTEPTCADVIAAFEAAGLEVGEYHPLEGSTGSLPRTWTEAIHFYVPSLCETCGGRVFVFESIQKRDAVRDYYIDLGESLAKLAAFSDKVEVDQPPWVFTHANLLVEINGDLPEETAAQYKAAFALASRVESSLVVQVERSTATPEVTPTITAYPAPTVPSVPEAFRTQIMKFLEEGAKATALTAQGVTNRELSQQLVNVKAPYSLLVWPSDFAPGAKKDFEKAFGGWDLVLTLWDLKLNKADNPVEPNINSYLLFLRYAGDALVFETHSSNFVVKDYRGKRYLPFDENIRILLGMAATSFDKGKQQVLSALQ